MQLEIRPITPDEFTQFRRVSSAAFGEVPGEDTLDEARRGFELERGLAAFDAGRIVGTAGAYSFDLTLPGLTTLPVAGVSWVGVLPTHRRRGILRQLMRRQLDDVRARGEAVAILTASESGIYRRFGYGLGTSQMSFELDRGHGALAHAPDGSGQLTLIDHDVALELLPRIYDQARRRQPSAINRNEARWAGIMSQPNASMGDLSPRFFVTYESGPGQVDGLLVYRVRTNWDNGIAAGTLVVRELIALTTEARAALWRYCLSVDLIASVRADHWPVDEPLRWMLADPRRLRVTSINDDLWVRLVDIPVALAARGYGAADSLVLAVHDPFVESNTGRYALDAGTDGATCQGVTAEPDLALDVADLGAAYLGGVRFATLARAGRVVELTPGALRRADALFVSDPPPYCGTGF